MHTLRRAPTWDPFPCSAGFDINQFASGGALDDRVNDAFCELLESGPKPSVAAVEVRRCSPVRQDRQWAEKVRLGGCC
jgi:hypothetical protein